MCANKSLTPLDQVRHLIEETNRDDPNPADVKELRRILAEHPDLWTAGGDMAQQAALHLIEYGVTATAGAREAMRAGWNGIRSDLERKSATPLEKLLIDQIALCWLRHYVVEQRYTNVTHAGGTYESLNYWERRLNAAQRRYLRACETLARVRKIIRRTPALQINIAAQGGQQVNVAGEVQR